MSTLRGADIDTSEDIEAFLERERELRFQPHLDIEVPRETFERVLERAGMEDVDADEFSPYSPGRKCNAFEDVLFEYYAPTFTWRVDDGDSADDEQWFPWEGGADGDDE